MDQHVVKAYLQAYKDQFEGINQQELYKWKAVKQFQDHWDIEAEDFYTMLDTSLSRVQNLLASGQYFPKKMILQAAHIEPEEVRRAFKSLYNEETDIFQRMETFKNEMGILIHANFDVNNHYQDHRAIMVYLALRYPERYFLYKFQMFKTFSKKMEYPFRPIAGRLETVRHFHAMCEDILPIISQDQELLQMHNGRLNDQCYIDEGLHILTQDFIYAVARHLNDMEIEHEELEILSNIQSIDLMDVSVEVGSVDFSGHTINHMQNQRENKRIGGLGELFVLAWEKKQLTETGNQQYVPSVRHHARDKGDGLGYDIISKNSDGTDKYIEVKTTKGGPKTVFFMTKNELHRSIREQDNYYLYRVYNFNENTGKGDILILNGDLTPLCVDAVNYKIKMN